MGPPCHGGRFIPNEPVINSTKPNSVLSIQIQKPGGHLNEVSKRVLQEAGYDDGNAAIPFKTRVITGRLSDAIENVADGFVDAAIVSSDVLERWQKCASEACRNRIEEVADLGLAGCCSMFLVPEEYRENWRKKLNESAVVTSDPDAFLEFKKQQDISYLTLMQIIVREGGTESTARQILDTKQKPVFIYDLVATGKSAFNNGFIPTARGEESRVVLIVNRDNKNPELLRFCTSVKEKSGEFQEAARDVFLNTLTAAYDKETRPEPRAFLANRILELSGDQQ